jgi:thiol-disulfide isomerase/thioredoxin
MDSKSRNIIIIIVLALVVVGVSGYLLWAQNTGPGKLDDFAKCLKDKGAIFYGAFWCPHCQNEKSSFGSSKQYLPYVECSTPDSNGQLQVCKDAGVTVYPTWKFADGSKVEGEMSLKELADKTGCVLPQ